MAKDMHPPYTSGVVSVADEQVEAATAAGFTPVKSERKTARAQSASKSDK